MVTAAASMATSRPACSPVKTVNVARQLASWGSDAGNSGVSSRGGPWPSAEGSARGGGRSVTGVRSSRGWSASATPEPLVSTLLIPIRRQHGPCRSRMEREASHGDSSPSSGAAIEAPSAGILQKPGVQEANGKATPAARARLYCFSPPSLHGVRRMHALWLMGSPPIIQPSGFRRRMGRVLVIDDEQLICRALSRVLADQHEVVAVTRAAEALARLH